MRRPPQRVQYVVAAAVSASECRIECGVAVRAFEHTLGVDPRSYGHPLSLPWLGERGKRRAVSRHARTSSAVAKGLDQFAFTLVGIAGQADLLGLVFQLRHGPVFIVAGLPALPTDLRSALGCGGIRDPRSLLLAGAILPQLFIQLGILEPGILALR